ncbi:hypothetical protein R9C00_15705 [Flammeovirgaceae bacterium SG7u.111]|nr:hypothetical protein [Flammeovirgaceae bacterium SG7u.132]WPO33147.1 hypothetical protein R9C00_15705 [Flammeovirgaceae bacterium SG7u.111]
MTKVKGTAIITTRDYVKREYSTQYTQWLASLPADSRILLEGVIDSSSWYDMEKAYIIPSQKVIDLFFDGDMEKGSKEMGINSAAHALKGVYKAFLLLSTPQFLMTKASKIFTTYFEPTEIVLSEKGRKHLAVRILKFPMINEIVEYRIAGWMNKALEMANCKELVFERRASLAKGDEFTEFAFEWK